MVIPESVRTLVAHGPLVHLTTLNAGGGPHVTIVWIGIEGDEFVSGHMLEWKKIKNVRRDPRVALSFLGKGKNALGLDEYVVAYGEARITEGGAADLLQRLAHTYIGPGVEFPPPAFRSNPGFVLHIRPTRFGGVGPWAER
ncbi:MAG: TIGR03618 family F420-dependent PPOX class oxidoreductase [Candidatus Lambdaproteobacteria bacterium]|nr:TIGR03618 family F420-dependent PPOX class oxidoreductase [Candidatus Lambdaproteobacteria bacterium]